MLPYNPIWMNFHFWNVLWQKRILGTSKKLSKLCVYLNNPDELPNEEIASKIYIFICIFGPFICMQSAPYLSTSKRPISNDQGVLCSFEPIMQIYIETRYLLFPTSLKLIFSMVAFRE